MSEPSMLVSITLKGSTPDGALCAPSQDAYADERRDEIKVSRAPRRSSPLSSRNPPC